MSTESPDFSEENRAVVDAFIQDLRGKKERGTIDLRRSHLNNFLEWCEEHDKRMTALTPREYDEYIRDLIEYGYSDKYIIGLMDSVAQVYRQWIVGSQASLREELGIDVLIDEDPTQGKREEFTTINDEPMRSKGARENIVALSEEEAARLVAADNVPNPRIRNQLLLKLLLRTGIRAGEARDIRLSDVDRSRRTISIRGEKTNENRTVVYPQRLAPLFDRWIDQGMRAAYAPAASSNRLFITNRSGKMSRDRINQIVKQAAENAGVQETLGKDANGGEIRRVTTHTLRHTFGRLWVENDGDIARLAKLMGHMGKDGTPNLGTTRQYLREFGDESLRDAVDRYVPTA